MDSPARKLLKQKDYQRHKMFRKMARKRKAKAEQEQKVAEKALKRKLKLPKYDDGKPNLFKQGDRYFYQESPESKEISVTPINTTFDNPAYWTYQDAEGRVYTPKQLPTSDPGEIKPAEQKNVLESALDNYVGELKYDLNNNVPVGGKYTMPAIAASALLPLAGEYIAGTSIAGIPTTTLMNNAIGLGFAGHGLNHLFNEGINGYGDAVMTALELSPLGKLSLPIYRTGKAFANPFVLLVVNDGKWLWNEGNIIQKTIPYNPNNFYRGVGKEALKDAKESGVIRGKYFKSPYFGKAKDWWNDGVVYEGTPERIDWIDAYPYDEEGRVIPFSNQFPFNALPYENGSTIVPTKNFSYWLKHPIIGWRKHSFGNVKTPTITAENAASPSSIKDFSMPKNNDTDKLTKLALNWYLSGDRDLATVIAARKFANDGRIYKSYPQSVSEELKNTVLPRLKANRPWMKEREIENLVLQNLEYGMYPGELFDQAGHKSAIGLHYPTNDGIAIRAGYGGTSDKHVLGHEVRHRIDKALPTTEMEDRALADAYDNDFIEVNSWIDGPYNPSPERVTTNSDARVKLLGNVHLQKTSPELQNKIIDKASDEQIFNAVETANGYGQAFIKRLRRRGKLTREKANQLRLAMKVVPATLPFVATYSLALQYNSGKDIRIKPSKRGTFTAAAKRRGMGVQEFARKVLSAPKGKYSSAMRKKANFARNASKFKH